MHAMAWTAAAMLARSGASLAFGGERTYGKHRSEHRRRMDERIHASRVQGRFNARCGATEVIRSPDESVAEFNARLQAWRAVREVPAR